MLGLIIYFKGYAMAQFADQFTNAPKYNFLTGSKGGFQNIPIYDQQQSEALQNILNRGIQGIENPGSSPIAQSAINRFNTQTIPGLAERFTAMGGGQNSSAFQGALGSAGSGLQQELAGLDYQQALPLLQMGLQQKYQTAHIPGQQGFLQSIAGPLAGLTATGLTGGIGGGLIGGSSGIGKGILAALTGGGQGLADLFGFGNQKQNQTGGL